MTINSMATMQMQQSMTRLSTMQRINSAADDAAGLAISQGMEAQIRGTDMGTRNTRDMQSLVNVAEGGLATIDESLQRVRELSVQASNGILTDDQRAMIQTEIGQMLDHVNSAAANTQFNGMNLLDGSFQNAQTASDAMGRGASVSIGAMDADTLGVANFNVTGNFDIGAIDNALAQVNSARAELGALSNRFDHTVASNNIASLNQAAARSRIADTDAAREVTELRRASLMQQYQIMNQRREQENAANMVMSLLG